MLPHVGCDMGLVHVLRERRRACITGRSSHAAAFVDAGSGAVLSYGENIAKTGAVASEHAEENAMRKLPALPRKRHLKRVDLMVIRTSAAGTLGSSKPCTHCVGRLCRDLPKKGYQLDRVYFSEMGGAVTGCPMRALITDENAHVSRYYAPHPDGSFCQRMNKEKRLRELAEASDPHG